MTKIEVELHDDVISIINKLKEVESTGIELFVPEGAVIFENILNLKLIKKWSEENEKVINFDTDDVNGQNMLLVLDEDSAKVGFGENGDEESDETKSIDENVKKQRILIPKVRFPKIKFGKGKFIIAGVIVALLIGLGFLGYSFVSELPQAEVKIVVNSQPLTRSFEIKIKDGAKIDGENKVFTGKTIEVSTEEETTVQTTGEKIIGESAEGKVTIYNKTDDDKEFKEGTDLTYENDDNNYKYELKDDVEVPARTVGGTLSDPEIEFGSAEVEVEAKEIGDDYNIDEGETLEVEDQDRDEFEAEVTEDIDGGKEEKIKIVAQEDLDSAKDKVSENSEENILRKLDQAVENKQKLVEGSSNIAITSEDYNQTVGDEAEEVSLKQVLTAKALTYNPDDLDKLIDEIAESFIPEGYVLSTKERVVNVEILGNTENTVLNETEADIQVTLKTFVIPDISEENVKMDLYGKGVGEAQRILGSIKNVKTYELNLSPRIPFLDYIPKDENRVNVSIERQ